MAMAEIAHVIKRAFVGISEEDAEALGQVAQAHTYPPMHRLIEEGAIEHVFYIVVDGEVAISQKLDRHNSRNLTVCKAGDFFGEMALIESKPRAASAVTLIPTTVIEITEEVFNEFLSRSPRIALALIRRITSNLRASDQTAILDLSRKNIELARAYEELKAAQQELVKKERLERELEIAAEVQRSLLPSSFPAVSGYSFAGHNVPARHVGGDLYDVIRVDDDHVGLLMADVSDKSIHAALIMAVTRTLFLSHARRSVSPAEVALAVHDGLLEVSSADDMFVTVFYGVLHTASGWLSYVRAGQDNPLLFRARGGAPELLDPPGRFLGMLPDLKLEDSFVQLERGDLLVTYSDGVPDAINPADESYGLGRLISLIEQNRRGSAADVCQAMFADVFAFRGDAPAFDDITVLVMRCEDTQLQLG